MNQIVLQLSNKSFKQQSTVSSAVPLTTFTQSNMSLRFTEAGVRILYSSSFAVFFSNVRSSKTM